MKNPFIGKGKTIHNPARVTLTEPLYFGHGIFPAGCTVRAFETRNFGFVIREGDVPRGETKIARV